MVKNGSKKTRQIIVGRPVSVSCIKFQFNKSLLTFVRIFGIPIEDDIGQG